MELKISTAFDGGNIEVIEASQADNIRLKIRPDAHSHFYQWFYFRVVAAPNTELTLHLENAGEAAYPGGWQNYAAVISYDLKSWTRTPTRFHEGVLTIQAATGPGSVYVAYFAPYTAEQHRSLVALAGQISGAEVLVLGQTLDGRDLDLIKIDRTPDRPKPKLWITARQHPGETMAEWWMEGLIERLARTDDPEVETLLQSATLFLVPNMNPDGSARGHLRTNAAGVNLNREWQAPSLHKSPEVFLVREKMQDEGIDLALDVHGDEALPYNFIAGTEGIASWSDRLADLLETFKQTYVTASDGAFQTAKGYPVNPPGKANLNICSNALAADFDCLAMTLEMPFKDDANHPDAHWGWSPERSKKLGAESVAPMLSVLPKLR